MGLSQQEINLLVKIDIGQRVRSDGIVETSLNTEEISLLTSLLEKKLIKYSYWKAFRNYNLYITTEEGSKKASISIQEILYNSNLIEEIKKIPLIFLKLCFFNDDLFYIHETDIEFEDFYWDEGEKEFLIEKGLKYREMLINLFKNRNLCVESYYYVSTNGGEIRGMNNIIPEAEVKEYLNKKFGIIEGLSEKVLNVLSINRQKILKKRENLLFDGIVEDFSPKYTKIIESDETVIKPILQEKGIIIFMSYSTKEETKYGIKKIAEKLMSYKDIQNALYWQEDADDNIYEYMDESLGKCDVFVLFCSPDALKSDPIKKEWTAADSMNKPIIPVFVKEEHIPPLLSSRRGLEFDMFNLLKFIDELHDLIIKKVKAQ